MTTMDHELWQIGEKIEGRFLIKEVKQGGLGTVYLCYDEETQAPYALKTVQDRYFKDVQSIEAFRNEAEKWVRLDKHLNVVNAYGVLSISERPYILMELIAGQPGAGDDLSGWISGHFLDVSSALYFAIQFCRAMNYVDRKFKEIGQNFIHRDIKPSNILITCDRIVKVTDFGLAKTVSIGQWQHSGQNRSYSAGEVCGTPAYMSPEQCQGDESLDIRADIYAFGCVLYEMFSGAPPFTGPDFSAYRSHHLSTKPRPLKKAAAHISRKLNTVVMTCLEKNPVRRYPDFHSLGLDLIKLYEQITGKAFSLDFVAEELQAFEWSMKGLSLLNLGKTGEAMGCLERAIAADARLMSAWNNKGLVYLELDEKEKALYCFDKAIESHPNKPEASTPLNNKGVTLDRLGKFQESLACYDAALEVSPVFFQSLVNKAAILDQQGRKNDAGKCYEKALKIVPKNLALWNNLTLHYKSLGKLKKALSACDRALKINPQHVGAYINKGTILLSQEQPQAALICFEQSIAINEHEPLGWYNRSIALARLGNPEEALASIDRALALNPEYASAWWEKAAHLYALNEAYQAIECYRFFLMYCSAEDARADGIDKAIKAFDRQMASQGDHDHMYNRGQALCRLNCYQQATVCFEEAIKMDPKNEQTWFGSILSYHQTGHYEKALQACDNFIQYCSKTDRRIDLARQMKQEIISILESQEEIRTGEGDHRSG